MIVEKLLKLQNGFLESDRMKDENLDSEKNKLKEKKAAPELRFEGFLDDWEQRKLGNIKDVRDGTHDSPKYKDEGYPLVTSKNLTDTGLDLTDISLISQNDFDTINQRSKVDIGDILFGMIGTIGKPVLVDENEFAIKNVALLKKGGTIKNEFLIQLLKSPVFNRYLCKENVGGTQKFIGLNQIRNFQFFIPSIEEQIKIGIMFQKLDHTITLHQRKLDKLKQLKHAYLQQLFPQNGEKIPRVRFANFEDKWEERKLGNIGKIQSGVGFPETEQGGTQGIPFYKVSDMNNLGNETAMKNSNNYVNTDQIMRKKWKPIETVPAIIFAKVGAAIMLNRKRLVEHSFLIDNNTMAYIFYDSWDTKFGKTVFETINLPRYAQVGALPSYNGFDIESIVIKIPNKSEQAKIGNFFKQLDNSAALHQEKLKQLKKIKKALLQKMFI